MAKVRKMEDEKFDVGRKREKNEAERKIQEKKKKKKVPERTKIWGKRCSNDVRHFEHGATEHRLHQDER